VEVTLGFDSLQPDDAAEAGVSAAIVDASGLGMLAAIIAEYDAAAPADLERLSLQRRFDRKFLVPSATIGEVLRSIREDYRVVLAGAQRFAHYDTWYFDTPTLRFYHDHRRRRSPRFKVRIRNYADRNLSVLEFKEKTSRGDTSKRRWERSELSRDLTPLDLERLASASPRVFAEGSLVPVARTVFYRLMLLNRRTVERATLDFNLALERDDQRRTLDSFVIVEVKDVGRGQASPLIAAVRRAGGKSVPFSKYCAAVALLSGERANTFRPTLRAFDGAP
jgi:hypothetical protein